ncbi:MAG: hypothetical protein AAF385_04665 [Pseudomonadota bacterium]
MLKLYKMDEQPPRYWETWDNDDGSHTVHWGALGETGNSKTIKPSLFKKATNKIQTEIDEIVSDGFGQIDLDEHRVLLIEYSVDGFGTREDLEKRHELESRMNGTLGWTGLGLCDGGSIDSGTMEVCCYVVDYELAKKIVEADLMGTEFADYTRVYDEGAEKKGANHLMP